MHSRLRLGLVLLFVPPLFSFLTWRLLAADAIALGKNKRAAHEAPRAQKSGVRKFSLCNTGNELIIPCATHAKVYVHAIGNQVFEIDNNSTFDDITQLSCTKPSIVSACSVTPAFDTIKAGRFKDVTLSFTAGAAGGTGVVVVQALGNVQLKATDTITVSPVQVLAHDTTIARAPDTTFTQSFTVKNLGSVADTVNLTKTCSAGFTCTLLTATPMALAAPGSGTANVGVTTSGQGTSGTVTLSAIPTHGVGGDTGTVTVNIPVPLSPTVSVLPHNGYNRNATLCAVSCFNVTAGYSTPAYTSLDMPRSVSLVYSSAMAYPLGVCR